VNTTKLWKRRIDRAKSICHYREYPYTFCIDIDSPSFSRVALLSINLLVRSVNLYPGHCCRYRDKVLIIFLNADTRRPVTSARKKARSGKIRLRFLAFSLLISETQKLDLLRRAYRPPKPSILISRRTPAEFREARIFRIQIFAGRSLAKNINRSRWDILYFDCLVLPGKKNENDCSLGNVLISHKSYFDKSAHPNSDQA